MIELSENDLKQIIKNIIKENPKQVKEYLKQIELRKKYPHIRKPSLSYFVHEFFEALRANQKEGNKIPDKFDDYKESLFFVDKHLHNIMTES